MVKSKRFYLYLFSFLIFVPIFFMVSSGRAYADNCKAGEHDIISLNAGLLECAEKFYVYNPWATYDNKWPTFTNPDGEHIILTFAERGVSDVNVKVGGFVNTAKDKEGVMIRKGQDPSVFTKESWSPIDKSGPYCSMVTLENCSALRGTWDKVFPPGNFGGTDQTVKDNNRAILEALVYMGSVQDQNAQIDEICDQKAGALGFILCPFQKSLLESIQTIIGMQQVGEVNQDAILIKLLIVDPLDASKNQELKDGVNKVVGFANSIYILLFIVIILASATSIGLDNYTIKKALPRLIVAIILTQFSFLICALAIDLGNILGFYLPKLFGTMTRGNTLLDSMSFLLLVGDGNKGLQFLLGGGAFLVTVILAIVILVVLLIAIAYMIARILILYILVLLAPLAFASMVLPGTQGLFKSWAKNFIKLILVFPLITSFLTFAGVISTLLITSSSTWTPLPVQTGVGDPGSGIPNYSDPDYVPIKDVRIDNPIMFLAGSLIPAIALCFIPKMFKMSGDIMAKTGGVAAGYMAGKASGGAKDLAKGTGQAAKQSALNTKASAQGALGRTSFGQNSRTGSYLAGTGFRNSRKNMASRDANQAETQKKAEEDTNNRTATMDRDALRDSANTSLENVGRKGIDNPRARGEATAHIDRLVKTGDSAGLASTYQKYATSAHKSGLGDQEIANNWNRMLGSNFGDVKDMSPSLIGSADGVHEITRARPENENGHLTRQTYNNPATGNQESYVYQSGGDYSALGATKLAGQDAEMLQGVVHSVQNGGASIDNFNFNQAEVQEALTNPNIQWGNANGKSALREIASMKGWTTTPPPTTTPPTPPSPIPFNPNTSRNPNNIPGGSGGGTTGPGGLWTPGGP